MIRNIILNKVLVRWPSVQKKHALSSITEGIRIPTTTSAVSLLSGDYSSPRRNNRDNRADTEDDQSTKGAMFEEREERERAAKVAAEEEAKIARLRKWLENTRPPVRVKSIDEKGRAYGKGGRKTASSRVWVYPGEGNITVNGKDFVDYFPRQSDRELILMPFVATQTSAMFDVNTKVRGGGKTGQAGAVRLSIARALQNWDPDLRPSMKVLGLLTRDPRMVERKKTGLKKARKAPQWVKR